MGCQRPSTTSSSPGHYCLSNAMLRGLFSSVAVLLDRSSQNRSPHIFLRRNMVNGFRPPVTLSDDLV